MPDTTQTLLYWLHLLAPQIEPPELEYRFDPARRWRFDCAYVWAHVAVELDGGQWQARGGRHNTDADRWKMSTAASLGWRVIRLSPDMLATDPARCIELIAQALGVPLCS